VTTLLQWSPTALSAPELEEDWSLEVRDSDADLVAQRFAKLRRSPFDTKQWNALKRAIGLRGIARRVSGALARKPDDVRLTILDARLKWALGDPGAAAARLAEVQPRAGRLERRTFALRIDALEAARGFAGAVAAVEERAAGRTGAARESLLERAYALATRGHLRDDALRMARRLSAMNPDSFAARLRLARAARQAGKPDEADRAYARAAEQARTRTRADVTAERARARLAADDPAGAAALVWSLLEQPSRGRRDRRERWWTTLVDAHRRDGSAAVLAARLADWLAQPKHREEAAGWRALARAQEAAGGDPIPAWQRAVQLRPKDTETRAALIDALEASGRTDEAVATYRATAARTSAEVQLGLELANRLAANGDREGAAAIAAGIEARAGRRSHTLLLLLDFYNLNNEPTKALAVARRLVEVRPRDPEARVALGEQLYQMHQVENALAQWSTLPKLVRPKHRGYARLAGILNEHGRHDDAFRAVGKALKLAPREPQYLRLQAVVFEERRRGDKALRAWQAVLEVAKGEKHELLREEARTRIVELLVAGDRRERDKLVRARREAREALERGRPLEEAVEAGLFLAELYTRQENYRLAVEVQGTLLELQPGDPDRLAQLAAAQRRAGQAKAAAETLETLLEADSSRRADVLAELSELAFETGDPHRALEVAARAARAGGSSTEALVRLGELHERRGDMAEAARAYEEALKLAPRDTRAHLRLAELELWRGKVDAAARAFRAILEAGGLAPTPSGETRPEPRRVPPSTAGGVALSWIRGCPSAGCRTSRPVAVAGDRGAAGTDGRPARTTSRRHPSRARGVPTRSLGGAAGRRRARRPGRSPAVRGARQRDGPAARYPTRGRVGARPQQQRRGRRFARPTHRSTREPRDAGARMPRRGSTTPTRAVGRASSSGEQGGARGHG
jgi:tetratricopeptide (TPR) repeat protein